METTVTVKFRITDKDEAKHTGHAQRLVAVIAEFARKLADSTKVPHTVTIWTSDDKRPGDVLPRTYLELGRIPTSREALEKWIDTELPSLDTPYGIEQLSQAFEAGWNNSTDNEQLIFALYNLLSSIISEKTVHMPNLYRMEVHRRFTLIQDMLRSNKIKASVIPNDAQQAYEILADLFPHRAMDREMYIITVDKPRYRAIQSLIARLLLDRKKEDKENENHENLREANGIPGNPG